MDRRHPVHPADIHPAYDKEEQQTDPETEEPAVEDEAQAEPDPPAAEEAEAAVPRTAEPAGDLLGRWRGRATDPSTEEPAPGI